MSFEQQNLLLWFVVVIVVIDDTTLPRFHSFIYQLIGATVKAMTVHVKKMLIMLWHSAFFKKILSDIHGNLMFTIENQKFHSLSFLDVLATCNDSSSTRVSLLLCIISLRATWSSLYLHFFTFVPIAYYEKGLVLILFDRSRENRSLDLLSIEIS